MEVFMHRSVFVFAILAVPLLVLLPGPAAAFEEICAERWARDYVMQKRCLKRMANGHQRVERFVDRHHLRQKLRAARDRNEPVSPYLRMFILCTKRWKVRRLDTADFFMWARCLDKQEKAYESLNRSKK